MIRENWRVFALVLLLIVSGVMLFVPGVGLGDTKASGPTNLAYGLELSGGTRIQAPFVGHTVESASLGGNSAADVEAGVAADLEGVERGDVAVVRTGENSVAVEVAADVERSAFADALSAAGVEFQPDNIRRGVTQPTREETIRVITSKINEAGLSGGTAQTVYSTGDQRYYARIEVPNENRSAVVDLVNTRGEVQVYAYHSVQRNGSTVFLNRTVLEQGDFEDIGIAQSGDRLGPHVPVRVKAEDVDGDGTGEAEAFQQDMVETGIASSGGTDCGWPGGNGPCLLTVVDGKVVYSAGMAPRLADSMRSGEWAKDPGFVLQTTNITEARELAVHLRAGALPARLDIQGGDVQFVAASLGTQFRLYSLITGIIAVLAVAIVVFLRYGDPKVAAPMVVTALSEVVILLGFAATVGLALNLSHIAGLIAVIGTGVDDLIIIADEVMAEGDVSSDRVFSNRFRKAFWVIGAAAVTTVIAMSPLAILSLGDLRGFAIVTILGVFIGVLITRPAYGDILRNLVTRT